MRGRREKVLRQNPQAWSRQPSWLSGFPASKSPEHFLSSLLLPFSQTASPPLPTCSNTPTGKAPFQQPTCPTHFFYQGCRPPLRQDHQDPTRAFPSLTPVQRSTPRTHLLACLSFCKIFRGGLARCPTNGKYKIILSPLQELFVTFPSLLKTSITISFPVSHSKYYF